MVFLNQLLAVSHSDPEIRRRGRNLIILAFGVFVMILLSLPLVLVQPDPGPMLVTPLLGLLVMAGVVGLARYGAVTTSGWTLIGFMLIGLLATPLLTGQIGLAPFFLVVVILIAGVAMSPWVVGAVFLGALVAIGAPALALAETVQQTANAFNVAIVAMILCAVAALISALGSHSAGQALRAAHTAQAATEQAYAALEHANQSLEQRVAERTAALSAALAEVEQRAATQTRLLEEVAAQRQVIRELSVPVLPVSAETMVMPLVGALDSNRLSEIQEQALTVLERSRARTLLLDVTGVPIVDSQVAQGLVGVVQAARLLGAETVLIGIRPEVAQTIVGLGLDLAAIRTARDLQTALQRTLRLEAAAHGE